MSIQIYTTCNPITIGCRLFRNNGRTIPTTEGIYFDGTTCWGVDPDGYVISVEYCTTTTTTTTTLAPVTFTATPSCVSGSGQIFVNGYSGGNGIFEWIAIGDSQASAISQVTGSFGSRYAAGFSYLFTDLSDGNYYVALRDSAGNIGVTPNVGISISCATTTTTSTTTTTTTTVSGFYYTVSQQDCSNSCAFVNSLVAFSTNSLTNGIRYNIGDGYVYEVTGSTSGPSYDIDLTGAGGNANCAIACGL